MTMPKEARIQQLKNRVDLLRGRGEELNSKLINKALRQIRKLEREEQEQ